MVRNELYQSQAFSMFSAEQKSMEKPDQRMCRRGRQSSDVTAAASISKYK